MTEFELTDVELMAWEGLLREQEEAASYVRELGQAVALLAGRCPRVAALLVDEHQGVLAVQTRRGAGLSAAVAKAHGQEPPTSAPRLTVEDGKPARLSWAAPSCPVAPPAPVS